MHVLKRLISHSEGLLSGRKLRLSIADGHVGGNLSLNWLACWEYSTDDLLETERGVPLRHRV